MAWKVGGECPDTVVSDPSLAINKNANFRASLYLSLQMALREIAGKERIDALLDSHANINSRMIELTSAKIFEFGVKLISADVMDITVPGEMKKAFAQVIKAQKEGRLR